jgi:diguanylate cyclase (GGDEF)-like protein/PAS domain S-box-containing protein
MRKLTAKLVTFLVIMLASMLICPKIEAQVNPNVLILNSYSRDFAWTDDQTRGFMNTFNRAAVDPTYFVEYLDWERNPTSKNWLAQYQLFTEKYGARKIDLIYTTDDAALKFAMTYRKELFSDAPVVYSGVLSNVASLLTSGERNVMGIDEKMDIDNTLSMMSRFNPQLDTVYLLCDDTESGVAARQLLERVAHNVNPQLSILYLDGPNYQVILDKLQKLPDNSAVLMATYIRDGEGTVLEPERYARMFSSNSRVPVYILYDFEMGLGAVGGSVLSGHQQGVNAAQFGLRILSGEAASDVTALKGPASIMMLDYQAMQRYKLPIDKIPEGSQIMNNPLEFYNHYKNVIWLAFASLLVMIGYILLLVRAIKRRKATECTLKKNNDELTALYEEIYASEDTLQQQYQELAVTQAALQKSQERYELSINGANDGLWDWDIVTDQVYFSERCGMILGVKTEGIKDFQNFFSEITVPECREALLTALNDHLKGRATYYVCKLQLLTAAGEKWILLRGKASSDSSGQSIRMAGSLTDITEQKKNEADINYLAYYDSLTGLANRSALNNYVQTALNTCLLDSCVGAMLFIDVDNFKVINDTLGHSCGDQLLIQIAQLLKNEFGKSHFVARMGGDEFIVFFQSIRNQIEAVHCADSISALFNVPFVIEEKILHVTISIGITLFPTDGTTLEELVKNADLAMYQAKSKGKNQYAFFDQSMAEIIRRKSLMEKSLREALSTTELNLWYQPIVDLATHEIKSFEALIRWDSRDYGLVMPDDFIGLAEESGLIIPIGKQMFKLACYFIQDLHRAGHSILTVTVNISAVQLMQNDFVESVQTIITETGVDTSHLGFEITESVLMESMDLNIEKLEAIKQLGITIYLDDFGTGYSSLKYLQHLPIDVVKIDKSFIDTLQDGPDSPGLTKIIIELAHHLGITTVAEGVETEQQLQALVRYNCDAVQGYFFSKPVPLDKVHDLLADLSQRLQFSEFVQLKRDSETSVGDSALIEAAKRNSPLQ